MAKWRATGARRWLTEMRSTSPGEEYRYIFLTTTRGGAESSHYHCYDDFKWPEVVESRVAGRFDSHSRNDRRRHSGAGKKGCQQKMRLPESASASSSQSNNKQTSAVESVRQGDFVIGYRPIRNTYYQKPHQKGAGQPIPGTLVHRIRISDCSLPTLRMCSLRLVMRGEVQAKPVPPSRNRLGVIPGITTTKGI